MPLFEKKPDSPSGTVTVTVDNITTVFPDGQQVNVTDPDTIHYLLSGSANQIRIVGGQDPWVPPRPSKYPVYSSGTADDGEALVFDAEHQEWSPFPVVSRDEYETVAAAAWRRNPRPQRQPSSVLGYFGKAGHGWTAGGGSANLNDTSVPMIGTQSIKIPVPASSSDYAQATLPAFSVEGKTVRLVWRYTGDITAVIIYLANEAGLTNRVQINARSSSWDTPGEDMVTEISAADFTVGAGAPDLAAITNVRIFVNAGPGGGTVWLGGLFLVDPPSAALPNGAVVMSFDDSRLDHWTIARPKLAEYGAAGVLFPNCATLISGSASFMSLAQAQYMQDLQGWEVGAHAIDGEHHIDHNAQDEAWLRDHAERLVAFGRAHGLRVQSFAWPNTASNEFCRQVMRDYFESARGGTGDPNEVVPPTRPMNFRAANAGLYTLAQMKAKVDRAKAGSGVVHFFFHGLPTVKDTSNDVARQDFYDLVDYVAAQGVPFLTQAQAMSIAA